MLTRTTANDRATSQPTDPYEVLQLHPSAHPLLVMRAFRVLAAMYHPDNKQTGDRETFEGVVNAYRLLSDPVRRAAYDREQGRNASAADGATTPEETQQKTPDERRLRLLILSTLYTQRRNSVTRPGLSLRVLADMTDSEFDEVQFSLWYLRGKKLVEVNSDDAMAITVAGVDFVEEHAPSESDGLVSLPGARGMLEAAAV